MLKTSLIEVLIAVAIIVAAVSLTLSGPTWSMITMLVLTTSSGILLFLKSRHTRFSAETGAHHAAVHKQHEHQLLLESIHRYPMPYAIYDEQDRLCVWNEHYEKLYAKAFGSLNDSAEARHLSYADLVRSNVANELTADELTEYVNQRVSEQRKPDGDIKDRHYPEFGWYRVSKYATPSGGVAGFAIDINELKQREADLMQEVEHRKRLEIEIREIANTDVLTGLANRRHFMELATFEYKKSIELNQAFSLLMMDIDFFKQINDSHGHSCGDEVISTVAKVMANILGGDTGRVGRVGGEEFAAILPGQSIEEAGKHAERIRTTVEGLSFIAAGEKFSTTISIGIATRQESDANVSVLLKRSDDALYASKNAGRNHISAKSA